MERPYHQNHSHREKKRHETDLVHSLYLMWDPVHYSESFCLFVCFINTVKSPDFVTVKLNL